MVAEGDAAVLWNRIGVSSHSRPARSDTAPDHSTGHVSHPVSKSDGKAGIVRIPIGDSKSLFPPTPCRIDVVVCGESLQASWNPRMGPDRERSGRLGIGRDAVGRLGLVGRRLSVRAAAGAIELT